MPTPDPPAPPSGAPASDRVPDGLVERLHLGELPAGQAARVRARLEAEPEGLARLAELTRSDAELLAAHPPRRVAAVIEARADGAEPPAASGVPTWLAPLVGLGAAAAAAFVVLTPGAVPSPVGAPPTGAPAGGAATLTAGSAGDRAKGSGGPQLWLHRAVGDGAERLADGASATQGDLIQVSYAAGGASHGVVLSVDGRGVTTQHFPDERAVEATTALEPEGRRRLRTSYELDDAPGFERFLFVTADAPIAVDAARAALQRWVAAGGVQGAQPLPDVRGLPGGARWASVTLTKEPSAP